MWCNNSINVEKSLETALVNFCNANRAMEDTKAEIARLEAMLSELKKEKNKAYLDMMK